MARHIGSGTPPPGILRGSQPAAVGNRATGPPANIAHHVAAVASNGEVQSAPSAVHQTNSADVAKDLASVAGGEESCATPNSSARVISAMQPQAPMVADGVKGTTIVTVSLAADSTVSSATISTSSGNLALDRAALQAARASRYSAPIENCRQQAGQLNIVEEFR